MDINNPKIDIKSLDIQETEEWVERQGLERYRAGQIRHWLFKKHVRSFDDMKNLSSSLRKRLKEKTDITPLEKVKVQVSQDRTEKFLFRLHDGFLIESVLIPERDHFTLCISSQAGCAMGCRFCLTAKQGLKRNLYPGEIIEQVIQAKASMESPDKLTNIVFMGMGEPLANYLNVLKAIGNLIADDGMNFSHRKITLSTAGIVPLMKKLGIEASINLAVSINAPSDKVRNMLMPINRKYPLKNLIAACKEFPLPNRRMITFEYILIKDINDRDKDAQDLAKLLSGIRAKINLIPLNTGPGSEFIGSSMDKILQFQDILVKNHFTAIIRKSKGRDISAACGQLSAEA